MEQEVINAIETRAVATEQKIANDMKAGFDSFQTQFSATYNKDAHKFRDWINANPLKAAREIAVVDLALGAVMCYAALYLLGMLK